MRGIVLQFASEVIEVRIDNKNVYFRTNNTNGAWATIDNIKLSYAGVCKEHPDLKDDKEWREKAIQRFKDKLKSYPSEIAKVNYIKEDLSKFGYIPQYQQRAGFRVEKLI